MFFFKNGRLNPCFGATLTNNAQVLDKIISQIYKNKVPFVWWCLRFELTLPLNNTAHYVDED